MVCPIDAHLDGVSRGWVASAGVDPDAQGRRDSGRRVSCADRTGVDDKVREGDCADATFMPDDWWVTECLDGDARVLLACHRQDVRYVEHALSIRVDRFTDRT